MHILDTLVCQSWGKYRWNMKIAGQNVLFWRGSIKVATSDCMRVSHSGTSKLKIPEILKIFWPASEPCREATSKYSDSIIPVPILPTCSYPPCKYEGMGMHSMRVRKLHTQRLTVCGSVSKLKIPEILKIFWPASEPCREATSKYRTR